MTSMAVLTPSYALDAGLCRELNRSVLAHTPDDVHHLIVVPAQDVALFASLAGRRTTIVSARSVLPKRYLSTPVLTRVAQRVPVLPPSAQIAAINTRRPWPPVRGWILQQLVKLTLASELGTDVVLLLDSDVELIRPVTVDLFRRNGAPLLYRRDDGVTASMPGHLRWHQSARGLLGMDDRVEPPLPDYISPFLAWDGQTLEGLRARVETVTGRPFLDALAGQMHLSEAILYGTWAESTMPPAATTPVSRSHDYWPEVSLDLAGAEAFGRGVGPEDVAISISAKSGTPYLVRRAAIAAASAVV